MSFRYDRRAFKRLRAERGLTLGEIARVSRLTERTVAYIEKGYSDPRASTLAKLAHALGVSIEAFFSRKEDAA